MDLKLLEEIGLTTGEVKVYLALLRLGASKTGAIAKQADVSSSKVYKILDRLEKKGLAGHVFRGEIKYFSAMEPKRLLDYLEEEELKLSGRRRLIENMMPELENQQKSAGQKSEAGIYDGFKAVTNFFRNILDELNPGEEYYVIGAGYGEVPGLRQFFHKHHQRRAANKIKLKMLANQDVKGRLEGTTKLNADIRYLPQYLITNMEIVFYKNKVFIAIWTREPKGFLIESNEAVKSFQAYFDALSAMAKKR